MTSPLLLLLKILTKITRQYARRIICANLQEIPTRKPKIILDCKFYYYVLCYVKLSNKLYLC